MKTWQIFLCGTMALVVVLCLSSYETLLAPCGAICVLALVLFGFMLRPRNDVFYIRTTNIDIDPDGELFLEHDQLAVRVEMTRLYLLFVPTFVALAFLLVVYARGTIWKISLTAEFWGYVYPLEIYVLAVIGLLSAWLGERWVLRDADACSAGSVRIGDPQLRFYVSTRRVIYHFVTRSGEYHGGTGMAIEKSIPDELGTIVLYNVGNPGLSRIGMGLLFHKLVVIGRGIPDLDNAKSSASVVPLPTEAA